MHSTRPDFCFDKRDEFEWQPVECEPGIGFSCQRGASANRALGHPRGHGRRSADPRRAAQAELAAGRSAAARGRTSSGIPPAAHVHHRSSLPAGRLARIFDPPLNEITPPRLNREWTRLLETGAMTGTRGSPGRFRQRPCGLATNGSGAREKVERTGGRAYLLVAIHRYFAVVSRLRWPRCN
jgi:hypothetical protein